jgi:hypothetical protein
MFLVTCKASWLYKPAWIWRSFMSALSTVYLQYQWLIVTVVQEHFNVLPASSVWTSQCSCLYPGVYFDHLVLEVHIPSDIQIMTWQQHYVLLPTLGFATAHEGRVRDHEILAELNGVGRSVIIEYLWIPQYYQECCKCNYMEQGPSWQANNCLAGHEFHVQRNLQWSNYEPYESRQNN